jgi:hypothetical protein
MKSLKATSLDSTYQHVDFTKHRLLLIEKNSYTAPISPSEFGIAHEPNIAKDFVKSATEFVTRRDDIDLIRQSN